MSDNNYGVVVGDGGSVYGKVVRSTRRNGTGAPGEQWTNEEGLLCTRIGDSAVVNIGQSGFTTGDRVRHTNRGLGTFLYYDGRDEACVDFGDGGARVTSALLEAA